MGFESDAMGTMHGREGTTLFESWRSMRLASNIYAGLMSPQDKIKLDGLENYVHPDTPAEIGTYMQVVIDKQGHVVGGRLLQDSTLSDYRIVDAYITPNHEIVLGENKIRPRMPDENVPWRQISNRPDTVAGYGIKDAYIAERLIGVINEHNLPERLRQPIATKKELKSAYSDVDVRLEAIRTLSYENFRHLFESMAIMSSDINTTHSSVEELDKKITAYSDIDVRLEAIRTLSYENFRSLFESVSNNATNISKNTSDINKTFSLINSVDERIQSNIKSIERDVQSNSNALEAIRTLSYENFRSLFESVSNNATNISKNTSDINKTFSLINSVDERIQSNIKSIERDVQSNSNALEAIRTLSYENFRSLFESIGEISSDVNAAHLSLKELNDKFTTHSNLSRQDLIATNSRLTNECNSLKNIISVLSTRLADVLEVLGRTDNGRAVNTFAGFTAPEDGTTWIQFGIDYIMEKDDGESIINQSFVAINDDGEVIYEYTSTEDMVCSYPDVILKFNSGEVVVNPMAKIIFGDDNVVIAGSGITQLFKPNYIENGEKARIVLDNGITIPVLSEYKVQGVYANSEIQEEKSEEGAVLPESPSCCTDEVVTDDDFDDIFS